MVKVNVSAENDLNSRIMSASLIAAATLLAGKSLKTPEKEIVALGRKIFDEYTATRRMSLESPKAD